MTKTKSLIGVLCLSLAVLSSVAFSEVKTANAALYCHQLTLCKGSAGCAQGGDVSGCDINCTGGGTARCAIADLEIE